MTEDKGIATEIKIEVVFCEKRIIRRKRQFDVVKRQYYQPKNYLE